MTSLFFEVSKIKNHDKTMVADTLFLIRIDHSVQYIYDGPKPRDEQITEMKLLGYVMAAIDVLEILQGCM